MPRKRVGEVSTAKIAQLKLRLTPTLDRRLATLSAMTGESKTSIGGTAMVMGLRILENQIMGTELAASSLEEAARLLMEQMEADADVLVAEAAERNAKSKRGPRKSDSEPEPESKPGMGLVRSKAELDEPEYGSMSLLEGALAFR